MTNLDVVEGFAKLLAGRRAFAWQRAPDPPWWAAEVAELRDWPLDGLRALWDEYDGCNSPLGFCGETIHAALNERGDGAYCAV